jgi:hypothetical protein
MQDRIAHRVFQTLEDIETALTYCAATLLEFVHFLRQWDENRGDPIGIHPAVAPSQRGGQGLGCNVAIAQFIQDDREPIQDGHRQTSQHGGGHDR